MPHKLKATNEEILVAYKETGNIWKAAELLEMCGQSVHERLVRLGIKLKFHKFTDAETDRLKKEYQFYKSLGKLDLLAESMGRTKTFICGKARELGFTKYRGERRYIAVWKYMSEEAAQVIFDKFKKSSKGVIRFCKHHDYGQHGFVDTMRKYFGDEWDYVLELKMPKQSMYRLGRAFEYRCRDNLRSNGYFVLRSPRSGSPTDLVAIKIGSVLFVQCKRGGELPPKEWNALYDLALSVGVIPLLASPPQRGKILYEQLVDRKDGSRRPQPKQVYEP